MVFKPGANQPVNLLGATIPENMPIRVPGVSYVVLVPGVTSASVKLGD